MAELPADVGAALDAASEEDAEYFKVWRLCDENNPGRVAGSTFAPNLAALRMFYRWAAGRYGVADPVAAVDDFDLRPHGVRDRRVKWLDPGGYRRWRDVGLRGLGLDERADPGWRARSEQRDAAFADGLYGSGLRLSEWASVLVTELPNDDPARGYSTCRLADACAKGGYGHKFWLPRPALLSVLDYLEGARARAARQAQQAGHYDRVAHARLVLGVRGGDRVTIQEADGRVTHQPVNVIDPRERRRLFRTTEHGMEPLALWLNEDGLPRTAHGWQHTFTQANERIAGLGLAGFSATPHMLRDSCALRWYAVGRLAYERRFGHLSEQETKDFRVQFGDTWDLVATILGHRSPETTKRHYLEPFRALDVELLVQHARGAAVDGFLASYLADHPLVRTDPLRPGRERRFGRAAGDAAGGGRAALDSATGPRRLRGAVRAGEPAGQVREFDFADWPVSHALQTAFAAAFAARTRPGDRVRRTGTAMNSWRTLRGFASYLAELSSPPRTPGELTPAHLAGWFFPRRQHAGGGLQLGQLKRVLRLTEGLSAEFRTALAECNPPAPAAASTASYSRSEHQRILNASRHDIRGAATRIRGNRELLRRWRLGDLDDEPDQVRRIGELLDHVDRYTDVPRYGPGKQPLRWVAQGTVEQHITALHLTGVEAAAFAVLLVGLTGQNRDAILAAPATHHRPDGYTGATGTAIVALDNPRRRARRHMDVP